jgi:hypothetical protein
VRDIGALLRQSRPEERAPELRVAVSRNKT